MVEKTFYKNFKSFLKSRKLSHGRHFFRFNLRYSPMNRFYCGLLNEIFITPYIVNSLFYSSSSVTLLLCYILFPSENRDVNQYNIRESNIFPTEVDFKTQLRLSISIHSLGYTLIFYASNC